ncbi:inner-membrane translocator [Mesobacillus foraminis]|uniref:inner-membrane translocator n=1 Tax=Mesobacillus foraminis TaxID=279826 RepID=UPI000EF4400E|nr:inner-membrane translocator [Mesobacillus foraminis]
MESIILSSFILIIILLNVVFYVMFKKGKLNLVLSGIFMMILAPMIGFSCGALLLHFYDWSTGGTGEGAGYSGAFLGLISLANGAIILVIGIIRYLITLIKK